MSSALACSTPVVASVSRRHATTTSAAATRPLASSAFKAGAALAFFGSSVGLRGAVGVVHRSSAHSLSRRVPNPFRPDRNLDIVTQIAWVRWLRYCGCALSAVVALAYANGALDDRADKGNRMYQPELISFIV
jgi:hypothetical protein